MSIRQRIFKWLANDKNVSDEIDELNRVRNDIKRDISEFKTFMRKEFADLRDEMMANARGDSMKEALTNTVMQLIKGSGEPWEFREDNRLTLKMRGFIDRSIADAIISIRNDAKVNVQDFVAGEQFIDDIIARIKVKQL